MESVKVITASQFTASIGVDQQLDSVCEVFLVGNNQKISFHKQWIENILIFHILGSYVNTTKCVDIISSK